MLVPLWLALGISNSLGNYITMVLDPSAPMIVKNMQNRNSSYTALLNDLGYKLDRVLADNNFTFVQLLDAIAVRWE